MQILTIKQRNKNMSVKCGYKTNGFFYLQKIVKRKGRNPKPKCKDGYCQICTVDFKIQFRNSTGSTDNLFKESGRKESKGLVLATACQFLSLHVPKNDHLSDRVCQPCA